MSTASNLSDPARLSARAALATPSAPASLAPGASRSVPGSDRRSEIRGGARLGVPRPGCAARRRRPRRSVRRGAGWPSSRRQGHYSRPPTCPLPAVRPSTRGATPDATRLASQHFRAAGGVVMGKTATTEFAAFTPTVTRNPHDHTRTPGGSSSGSAAAVADFQVPLAIGTQTAGSIAAAGGLLRRGRLQAQLRHHRHRRDASLCRPAWTRWAYSPAASMTQASLQRQCLDWKRARRSATHPANPGATDPRPGLGSRHASGACCRSGLRCRAHRRGGRASG
jgi:hypothetical protein